MITLVNRFKCGKTFRIDANFYVKKKQLVLNGEEITAESSAEDYATPVIIKALKDQPFQVPRELAQSFLDMCPLNMRGQPFFKCTIQGSDEDAHNQSLVNNEENDEHDYNFIDPWVFLPEE